MRLLLFVGAIGATATLLHGDPPTPPPTPASPATGLVLTQDDLRPYEEESVRRAERELHAWAKRLSATDESLRKTEAYAEDYLRFAVAYADAITLNRWNEVHEKDIALPPEPSREAQAAVRERWQREVAERERAIAQAERRAAEHEAELKRRELAEQTRRLAQDQIDEQRRQNAALRDEIRDLRREIRDSQYAIRSGTTIFDNGFRLDKPMPGLWPPERNGLQSPFLHPQSADSLLPPFRSKAKPGDTTTP